MARPPAGPVSLPDDRRTGLASSLSSTLAILRPKGFPAPAEPAPAEPAAPDRARDPRMIAVCLPPMWPGEQPPADGRNPANQPANPYLQPGYQQTPQQHPHAGQPSAGQPSGPWTAPTATMGPSPAGPGGGRRTKVIAIAAAAAVVAASAVTGVVLLRDGDGGTPAPGPTATSAPAPGQPSASADPRGEDTVRPTVAGWKVVVNPDLGVAFDVPAGWEVQSTSWAWWVSEDGDPDEKILVGMKAPAVLKSKWCLSDDDRDGREDSTALAIMGTRANKSARSTEEIARADSANWVYGDYTQPDREKVTTGPVTPFTTTSGLSGSVATSWSAGVEKKHKCDSDGKSTTFAFKTPDGDLASWSFSGAKGVKDEVSDATLREVMATIRLYEPSGS